VAVGALLWLMPMGVLMAVWLGPHADADGWFFTKAALLTFGGAYAVLPYVYQGAVGHYGWLTPTQMIDGLALGETTPGPLIMVVAFVGFVGGYVKAVFGPDSLFLAGARRQRWSPGSPSCPPSFSSWPAVRWSKRRTTTSSSRHR
jgi:chromate transporter